MVYKIPDMLHILSRGSVVSLSVHCPLFLLPHISVSIVHNLTILVIYRFYFHCAVKNSLQLIHHNRELRGRIRLALILYTIRISLHYKKFYKFPCTFFIFTHAVNCIAITHNGMVYRLIFLARISLEYSIIP